MSFEYSEIKKNEVKALLKQALTQKKPTEILYEKIAKTFPGADEHPTIPDCPLIHGNDLPDFLAKECPGMKVQGFGKTNSGELTVIFFKKD